MFKKMIFIILLIPCLLSCSKVEERTPRVFKSTTSFEGLIFFNTYSDLYGIDSNTREIKLHYSFNTQINYGAVSKDDYLYLSSIDKTGSSIYKIDSKGRIISRNKSLPNPYTLLLAEDKLIVDSALFDKYQYTRLQVFSTNDLKNIKIIDKVSNWITNGEPIVYKNSAILGIAPIKEFNRSGKTMTLNLDTLEVSSNTYYTSENPNEIYTSRIVDNLYILAFMDSGIVEFYNLDTNSKVKTLTLQNLLTKTPLTDQSTIWNYKILVNGDKLHLIITDLDNEDIYQYILEIDIKTFIVTNIVEFDKKYDLSNFDPKYIVNNDIYFQFLNSVLLFDHTNGEFLLSYNL